MLQSMTGYGSSAVNIGSRVYSIEIKGVNHRYLDIKIRLPREYYQFEETFRKEISQYITRGRVDVFIHYEKGVDSNKEIVVDKQLAQAYHQELKELAQMFQIAQQPSIEFIASRPDVIIMQEPELDLEESAAKISEALKEACSKFVSMRTTEAEVLAKAMKEQLTELQSYREQIKQRAPEVVKEYQAKLRERIELLLDKSVELNEDKLSNEIAFFADRASIDEELVRLDSHVRQFDDILTDGDTVGRKMDFLVQEMNREVNTIGSKSSDIEISRNVVEMKSIIEKIREQVQNIE